MIRYTDASTPVDDILAFPSPHPRNTAANEIAAARAYSLEVWVDAFNLEYRTPGHVLTGCWLTALSTLGQELSFSRIPDVMLTGLSATVGASLYNAFYSDVHAFGQSGPPTSPLTPGPAVRPLAGLPQAI